MEARSASVQETIDATAGLIPDNSIITAPAGAAPPVQRPAPTAAAPAAPAATVPITPAAPAANPMQPIVIDSPFGKQVYGAINPEEVTLTSFEDVQNFARDYLGKEIKEVKDLAGVFKEFKTFQAQATEAAAMKQQLDTYVSALQNLPKDVSLILATAMQGGDHQAVLQKLNQKNMFDYSKPFEAQDTVKLVNFYTGQQYTKESFDTLDPTAKSALTDSVRLKYQTDSNELSNFEDRGLTSTGEKQKKFNASVESSIANLVKANPGIGSAEIERVRQIMMGGISKSLFSEDRTTYAPDAAEKIAMMEFGKQTIAAQAQTIGDIVAKLTSEGVSQGTERIIMRSDRPVISGAGNKQNVIKQIVEQATDFLTKK
jgi:hypothetical protein